MPGRIPEITTSSIILVGSFNPTIFQPEWFARQGLLPQQQVDAAEVKVIVPEISHFETEQYVLQVTQNRFVAVSKPSVDPAPLRDLVAGAFYILEHTPVTAMGLNRQMHFALPSEEAWNRVGDRLAPKEPWNDILEGRPGMLSLLITSAKTEPPGSRYNVTVQPSGQVQFGVYFETNDHYEGPKDESLEKLMKILTDKWEEVSTHASDVANHILDWAAADG